jgi:uncharacterized protein
LNENISYLKIKEFINMNKTIDAFLEGKEIAIAGASAKKGNWGLALMKELRKKGYTVYAVNPKYAEIEDFSCYDSVKSLPASVEKCILAVNPRACS